MASRFHSISSNVVLTSAMSRHLRLTLKDYRACAEASYAALLEESGTILLDSGTMPPEQSAVIGALANGAFIAVRELSSRLGDDSCEGLFHQGRTTHFYIAPLTPVTFIITVFGNDTKLGIIRSALSKYAPPLRETLDAATEGLGIEPNQDGDLVLSPMEITEAA